MALDRRPAGAKPPIAPIGAGSGSADAVPGARTDARTLWRTGLAAWRAGDVALAADRFTRLADDQRLDGETLARAAFWAATGQSARPPAATGRPPPAAWPRRAATSSTACSRRGRWTSGSTSTGTRTSSQGSMLDLLIRYPAARRAIALGQVGERDLAEAEMRRLAGRSPARSGSGAGGPGARPWNCRRPRSSLCAQPRRDDRRRDGARYPVPALAAGRRLPAGAKPRARGDPRRERLQPRRPQPQGRAGADAGDARHRAPCREADQDSPTWARDGCCIRRTTWRWARPGCSSWPRPRPWTRNLIHLSPPTMPARAG